LKGKANVVRHTPATVTWHRVVMDQEKPKFDWIGWLATVPGIPAGWGAAAASLAPLPPAAQARPLTHRPDLTQPRVNPAALPERIAA
jgi:hypothetical protein